MPTDNQAAEKAVLGAILLDNDAFYQCADLKASDFSLSANQFIFSSMYNLAMAGKPIDSVSLVTELEQAKHLKRVGDIPYLATLIDGLPDRPSIEHYVQLVIEMSRRRQLVALCEACTNQCDDESETTEDCLSVAVDRILNLAGSLSRHKSVRVVDYSFDVYKKIKDLANTPLSELPVGLPTGIPGLDRLTTGLREGELWTVASWTGEGKCLGRGTPILMYDGSIKSVEHIQVGDLLMGPDSRSRRVLSLSYGIGQLHKIVPTKGDPYVVNDEHILCLQNTEPKIYGKVNFNIPVREFLAKDKRFREKSKGYRTEIEFPQMPTPVDPYYVGLWLGDGCSRVPVMIHNTEKEVAQFLSGYAPIWGLTLKFHKTKSSCPAMCLSNRRGQGNRLLQAMRKIGFAGEKHIPHSYLANCRLKRLELLAGLIDSDGDWNPVSKQFQITQKSQRLASEITFLARSLGFAAYCSPCIKRCQTGAEGVYHRVTISGDLRCVPVRVFRKKATKRLINKNPLRVGIKVEDAGIGDYFGFEITGDKRFVLGDFSVTHNSVMATQVIVENVRRDVPVLWFTQEMSKRQVMLRMIPQLTNGTVKGRHLRDPRKMESAHLMEFERTQKIIDSWPLWVNDSASMEITALYAHAMAMVRQHGIKLIVVDYLQLLKGRGDSRYERVSDCSSQLRELAKNSGVPILSVSQMSRPENREKRPPRIFDLKDSGSIEQDSHVIAMPYRPQEKDGRYTGQDVIIVGKQREGPTGAVKVIFDSLTLTFQPKEGDDGYDDQQSF